MDSFDDNVVSSFSLGEGEVVKLYQPQSLFHESMGRNISFPELLEPLHSGRAAKAP